MDHMVPVQIQVSVPEAGSSVQPMPFGWRYTNLTANGVVTLKRGPGRLHAVTLNIGGSSSNVAALFDGTSASGPRIATVNTTVSAGQVFLYDVAFEKGLTVAVMYGVAGDITVSWA